MEPVVRRMGVASLMLFAWSTAWAQDGDRRRDAAPPLGEVVMDGAFMPFSLPARVGATRAFAWGHGGYDSSRKGPVAETAAEVQLWGPLALRGGATYSNDTARMRPSVGLRAQFLRQETSGIDGAISVFFKTEGFTEAEGEIETFVSVGHVFDRTAVMGDLVYGQIPRATSATGSSGPPSYAASDASPSVRIPGSGQLWAPSMEWRRSRSQSTMPRWARWERSPWARWSSSPRPGRTW